MALLASVTSINSWALANARSFEEEFAGPPRERAAEPNSNSLGQPERADWPRGDVDYKCLRVSNTTTADRWACRS